MTENLSPQTFEAYLGATKHFRNYLIDQGMPLGVPDIRREHIEMFVAHLLECWKTATDHNRYRGCQSFFKWAAQEGEIKEYPMAHMKPPKLPENLPPVLN